MMTASSFLAARLKELRSEKSLCLILARCLASLSPRVGNRMHAKPRGGRASEEVSERSTKWK